MISLKTRNPRPQSPVEAMDEVWAQYAATHDNALRERLILANASLVKYVVDRMAISLPACLEYEDLISHGIVGLVQAVDRYDPSRGVPFAAFAVARIRGQVLDALRHLDLVPRSVRRRAREIEEAIRQLQGKLGRNPTDEEVADHLGISVEAVRDNLQHAACMLVSLDGPLLRDNKESLPFGELLEDEETITPIEHLEELDMRERLRDALKGLTQRERLVLSLYHEQELTMKEVGQVLGVSESRISQIYSKAILTLRASMLLVIFSLLFLLSAAGALGNGVPVKVFLNYLPDISNWGPEVANGEAVLSVGEGWVTVSVQGLPKLQDEVYVVWLLPREGAAIPIGKFNTDDAGAGDFEIRGLSLPQKPYELFLLTVEQDLAQYRAPGSRRSIAGRFPDPELKAVPPPVPPSPRGSDSPSGQDSDAGGSGTNTDAGSVSSLARLAPTQPAPLLLPVTGGVDDFRFRISDFELGLDGRWNKWMAVIGLALASLSWFIACRRGGRS